jgi:hypothetical protein
VAIVPLTFLPRYPRDGQDMDIHKTEVSSTEESSTPLDKYQRADLEQLVGLEILEGRTNFSERRRNNLDYLKKTKRMSGKLYEVHTSIVVDTSRGRKMMPLSASSVRKNHYRVPSRIQFHPPSSKPKGNSSNGALFLEAKNRCTDGCTTEHSFSDCYDLYIYNPRTDPLQILEVSVSMPTLVSLSHGKAEKPFNSTSNDIHFWEGRKETVPTGSTQYVATICPIVSENPLDWVLKTTHTEDSYQIDYAKFDTNLGYLQIKTQQDSLFILLEWFVPFPYLQNEVGKRTGRDETIEPPSNINVMPSLKSQPGEINLTLIPFMSDVGAMNISIENGSSSPAKVMRISLLIDNETKMIPPKVDLKISMKTKLQAACEEKSPHTFDVDVEHGHCHESGILKEGAIWENAIELTISIDSNETKEYLSSTGGLREIRGRILVIATPEIDIPFKQWVDQMKQNPFHHKKVVLQIPWTIKLMDGIMFAVIEDSSIPNNHLRHDRFSTVAGNAIDSLFFPFEPFDSRDWKHWPGVTGRRYDYDTNGIDHTIRIVTSANTGLNISNLRIVPDSTDANARVCERFNVSLLPYKSTSNFDLHDIGRIRLEYRFNVHPDLFRRQNVNSEINKIHAPSVCTLKFGTTPIQTGDHIIKLLIFTGRLELTSGDTGSQIKGTGNSYSLRGERHMIAAPMTKGFGQVLSWFQTSLMGSSLLKVLRRTSVKGRWKSSASLFRDYILYLTNRTEHDIFQSEGFVEPVVLHAGAVAHSEVLDLPLQLVNHNPVPIQVYIDVGAVEGMSISISRVTIRERGDGNSMLDHLPSQVPLQYDRIESGKWASHSREGLKKFLMSSEYALTFFNFLRNRDAIELSPRATAQQPILKSLFAKRAKLGFHADKRQFHREKMDVCGGTERALSSNVKIGEMSNGLPGPLLLSDDGFIVHRSNLCETDSSSQRASSGKFQLMQKPITIPPGGVGRFDLKFRVPERESLVKDVTSFFSSGLLMSTDHGQIMPIFVHFEALLGQLKLSRSLDDMGEILPSEDQKGTLPEYSSEVVLKVPLRLFRTSMEYADNRNVTSMTIAPTPAKELAPKFQTWLYPRGATDVPIYLSSSFSREITLRRMESCNPWFQVNMTSPDLVPNSSSSKDIVQIGVLRSVIDCPTMYDLLDSYHDIEIPENSLIYPSFYQCALEWLENRTILQPFGCGLHKREYFEAEEDATERALDALNQALTFSIFKYGNGRLKYDHPISVQTLNSSQVVNIFQDNPRFQKSGAGRGSVFVNRLTLDIYGEITDAWRVISELDLHSISSSFTAIVDYVYSKEKEKRRTGERFEPQSLTVSMRDIAIQTQLKMPHLVNIDEDIAATDRNKFDNDFFSVLEFPPTHVADVVSLMLPLKNPTGIPVKVKIATISRENLERDRAKAEDYHTLGTDEMREHYLEYFESVFSQTGFDWPTAIPGHSWWVDKGGFFQADDQGNLVQSRHNIAIKTTSKARVSVSNPSLFTQSAFITGCGIRCGLREDSFGRNRVEEEDGKRSPIGASAAAGASLVGRLRVSPDQDDSFVRYDQGILPGGTSVVDFAPSAFAIPFSAFDEIILPPYGEAIIGPILFRPPGRFGRMGCDALLDNDAIPFSEKIGEVCSSTIFQSMIILENSLTGLERVLLRGKGVWESVVFLDPIGSDALDAYGDLEMRNGQTTLIFPGSSISNRYVGSSPHPVTKAVIVQNDGDVDVEFSQVFFADEQSAGLKEHRRCSSKTFRILECTEDESLSEKSHNPSKEKSNIFYGFEIPAGSNKTIFIEHSPECTFQSEFVVLYFEFKRKSNSHRFVNGLDERWTSISYPGLLNRERLELHIGFEMSKSELKACIPLIHDYSEPGYLSGSRNISIWNDKVSISSQELSRLKRSISIGEALRHHLYSVSLKKISSHRIFSMFMTNLLLFALVILVSLFARLRFNLFCSSVFVPRSDNYTGNVLLLRWLSAFRCLSRVDPTSSELQVISREQIRQLVLSRYKTQCVINPQCIDSHGTFCRDSGGHHPRKDKAVNPSVKTLSNSLFDECHFEKYSDNNGILMPSGLGWRSQIARQLMRTDLQTKIELRSDFLISNKRKSDKQTSNLELILNPDQSRVTLHVDPVPLTTSLLEISDHDLPSKECQLTNLQSSVTPLLERPFELENDDFYSSKATLSVNTKTFPWTQANISIDGSSHLQERKKSKRDSIENPLSLSGATGLIRTNLTRAISDETTSTESSSMLKIQSNRVEVSTVISEEQNEEAKYMIPKKSNGFKKIRGYRKYARESPTSPSSVKSISSRSTKTETSSSPISSPNGLSTSRGILRPPPGLGPPPGFAAAESAVTFNENSLNHLDAAPFTKSYRGATGYQSSMDDSISILEYVRNDSNSALDQLYHKAAHADAIQSSSSLFNTIRATDENNFSFYPNMSHSVPSYDSRIEEKAVHFSHKEYESISSLDGICQSDDPTAQVGTGGGFDVLGFLDDLLEEAGQDETYFTSEPILPLITDHNDIPRQSRATAYGIFVDDVSELYPVVTTVQADIAPSPSENSASLTSAPLVPLITQDLSGDILNLFSNHDDSPDNTQDYHAGDFYARLLGE